VSAAQFWAVVRRLNQAEEGGRTSASGFDADDGEFGDAAGGLGGAGGAGGHAEGLAAIQQLVEEQQQLQRRQGLLKAKACLCTLIKLNLILQLRLLVPS
jgi:hypothetical protein